MVPCAVKQDPIVYLPQMQEFASANPEPSPVHSLPTLQHPRRLRVLPAVSSSALLVTLPPLSLPAPRRFEGQGSTTFHPLPDSPVKRVPAVTRAPTTDAGPLEIRLLHLLLSFSHLLLPSLDHVHFSLFTRPSASLCFHRFYLIILFFESSVCPLLRIPSPTYLERP